MLHCISHQMWMSAAQTMETVSIYVSTMSVLITVGVGMATDCPMMEGAVTVCSFFHNACP